MLGSALCIVQKKTAEGLKYEFVTKNPLLVSGYYPKLAPSEQAKGLPSFRPHLSLQRSEIVKSSFDVVRVQHGIAGVYLKRSRVGKRSFGTVLPYYTVDIYVGRLLDCLSARVVRLTYLDASGQERTLVTTYQTEAISNWLGSPLSEASRLKWLNWTGYESLGYMKMPDLQQPSQFVSVPVLRITRVEVL